MELKYLQWYSGGTPEVKSLAGGLSGTLYYRLLILEYVINSTPYKSCTLHLLHNYAHNIYCICRDLGLLYYTDLGLLILYSTDLGLLLLPLLLLLMFFTM